MAQQVDAEAVKKLGEALAKLAPTTTTVRTTTLDITVGFVALLVIAVVVVCAVCASIVFFVHKRRNNNAAQLQAQAPQAPIVVMSPQNP